MASTSARPRPSSQLPSTLQTVSSTDHLTPLRRPRSPVKPHYRPFSTCSFEYLSENQQQIRPRFINRRSSSFNMGFSFKDRVKDKDKELGRPRKTSDTLQVPSKPSARPHSPLRSGTSPQEGSMASTDRPISSHGLFTLHKHKGLKKKRSLASLLSAASEGSRLNSNTSPITHSVSASEYVASSPLSTIHPLRSSSEASRDNIEDNERPMQHGAASRFVRKNTWIRRQNTKLHPYPLEAPYMQAYDPLVIENDRLTTKLLRRLNPYRSPTFHDYGRKPPLFVLDLGCGSGEWLSDASTEWEGSQITGFDLVDILNPELRKQDNIRFVRGNFLKYPLPFADKSIDLVRMANLALCIPYDKWEFIFSEVQRILTIGGRLELIDDQIFFPYGPTPTESESASAPIPSSITSARHNKGASFFDLDDDFDDEDTLEGGDEDGYSMNTDSTLISNDGHMSTSPHDVLKHLPLSKPCEPRPAPLRLDDPNTPTSTTTITTTDTSVTARPSTWSVEAAASRDMEAIFESMLHKKFGIHSRPSEFVLDLMKHVFGNGRKVKSLHFKLAPKDSYTSPRISSDSSTGSCGPEWANDRDERISAESKVGHMIKPWFSVDKVKEDMKRVKWEMKTTKLESFISSSARSSEESFTPNTFVPEGISAKAASRLGINGDLPEKVNSKAAYRLGIEPSKDTKSENIPEVSPSTPNEADFENVHTAELESEDESVSTPSIPDNKLSAKAANRLGISYSALTEAAAASTRRSRSSSSSLSSTSSTTLQSPGLLLWPTTYIPVSPDELEMHACRHIHTLLGCKSALSEFVETHVDGNGTRLVGDEEFLQSLWDYECFRRRRFNWPSEIPEWESDFPPESLIDCPYPKSTSTPKSATFHNSSGPSSDSPPLEIRELSDSTYGPYMCDELIHVRTLRIYEAIKTDDYSLASLPFPRSPAPSPPKTDAIS